MNEMLRRPHSKPRDDCVQCKQRYLKCDETHPFCVNCASADFHCSFAVDAEKTLTHSPTDDGLYPVRNRPESAASPLARQFYVPPLTSNAPLNLNHLSLFNHWTSNTCKTFYLDKTSDSMTQVITRYALETPFFMYQVLALSAVHLACTDQEHSALYQEQSAELLGQALAGFQEISQHIDENTIIPAFLFSGLAGLQFFCETFNLSQNSNLDLFLEQLVHSIHVLRGVRAVLGNWWEFLLRSELKPMLDVTDPDPGLADETTAEFDLLLEKIKTSAELSIEQIKVYEEPIKQLLWLHRREMIENMVPLYNEARRVTAWPITLSADYTELLAKRQPMALIILAHYAVILHRCRSFWAVRTAGKMLLRSVDTYLDETWDEWLIWPRASILMTPDRMLN